MRLNLMGFWQHRFPALGVLLMSALFALSATPPVQADDKPADAHTIPVINGDIGPCSAEFTVKDQAGAPVYAARIRVHIAYGFGSFHKLDLQVGTNVDGKARFEGLPDKVKRPLHYEASEGDREGEAVYDPADNCKAERVIVIAKPASNASQP